MAIAMPEETHGDLTRRALLSGGDALERVAATSRSYPRDNGQVSS